MTMPLILLINDKKQSIKSDHYSLDTHISRDTLALLSSYKTM